MNQITKFPATLSLTPCARKLLTDNDGWTDGVPTTWTPPKRLTPMERQEAQAAIRALRMSLTPADPMVAMRALTRIKVHLNKPPQKSEAEWLAVIRDYADDLAEFPEDIITEGCERHRKSSPWWPHVSDLLAIMEPMLSERRNMLARAEKLAAGGDERPARTPPTGDERKRMADGFSSLRDVLRNMPGPVA
jgi:hypothetical protein